MTHRSTRRAQKVDVHRGRKAPRSAAAPQNSHRLLLFGGIGTVLAIGALFFIFMLSLGSGAATGSGSGGAYDYQVGKPAKGAMAPAVRLPAATGVVFDLSQRRGKTVLLYFQEGIGCDPCWSQLKDIESTFSKFHALGIDEVVSITTDSLDQLRQKVADERISTAVLADPDLSVSSAYSANRYGMMGTSRDGHTFVVVGPNGAIRWRADYGGAPSFTMYVPVDRLADQMRAGLAGT